MVNLLDLMDEAVARYAPETGRLRFLPETRYNRQIFPTIGQYDWFSGQLLYCLVRHLQPVRIIEVSCSSGYSSLFSALALQANRQGRLEAFELSSTAAEAAQANFERCAVTDYTRLWVGDVRATAATLLDERKQQPRQTELLFLDSEHTEEFARFYLDTFLPDAHPESLFHMHDILPPGVQLMYRPLQAMKAPTFRPKAWTHRMLRKYAPSSVPHHVRRWVTPVAYDALTSEARFGHRLAERIPAVQQAYVHSLVERYPALDGHRYDSTSVWRCSAHGAPLEWNESWWTVCGGLTQAYPFLAEQ